MRDLLDEYFRLEMNARDQAGLLALEPRAGCVVEFVGNVYFVDIDFDEETATITSDLDPDEEHTLPYEEFMDLVRAWEPPTGGTR
ncbi:hypothetical protein [Oerskovia turbata]